MKDLFVGALGRLNNHGGSRIYTTPNTVKVEPEYSINVSYNIQGDLIAHSLDGRLWLYRRSRRLGVIALRWNKETARLEYATAKNFSNNDDVVLARGLDWVLTNNNIFMVSDDEPYILSAPLFDTDIPDTYLYSFLRSGNIGTSGIDIFTGEAWGKREDNGNSEGTGYFSKSTHLLYPAGTHSMEHCYSLLPAVGDWQIVENFLVRRPDAESLDSYNYMQSVRPLIPLELRYGSEPAYGTGYNFNHRGIQLACVNGQLWGRGVRNIGRVYILPAVFDENGDVQEYYLYISPDYVCENVDDWLNIGLAIFGNNSVHGFLSQHVSPVSGGLCEKAQNTSLFDPQTKQWDNLSKSNGSLFVDALSARGLLLDEEGMKIIRGGEINSLTCRTLSQWIAPAGKVEAVDDDSVVASADKTVLRTSLVTGFNREIITPNTLPLSGTTFADNSKQNYRVAIHEDSSGDRKAFGVNRIAQRSAGFQPIAWENAYKDYINIKIFGMRYERVGGLDIASDIHYDALIHPYSVSNLYPIFFEYDPWDNTEFYAWAIPPMSYYVGTAASVTGYSSVYGSVRCHYKTIPVPYPELGETGYLYVYGTETYPFSDNLPALSSRKSPILIEDNNIGILNPDNERLYELIDISFDRYNDEVFQWIGSDYTTIKHLSLRGFFLKSGKIISVDNVLISREVLYDYPIFAIFHDNNSNIDFLCNMPDIIPSLFQPSGYDTSNFIAKFPKIHFFRIFNYVRTHNDTDEQNNVIEGLHVAIFIFFDDGMYYRERRIFFLSFRSQIHTDIFDFNSELERSKLS